MLSLVLRVSCHLMLLICFTILGRTSALADVEGFVVWQPDPGGVRYLLPRIAGEPPTETAARWLTKMKASKIYGKMENAHAVNLSTAPDRFSELPKSTKKNPIVPVVLNRPNQMVSGNKYLSTVVSSFEKHGPRLYAIPLGLELAVKGREMAQIRQQLNEFDGQLGVGGDDPHPRMYGQTDISHTEGDIDWRRDVRQSQYISEYLKNGKGRVFYICGSMQRAAIASGYGLFDDIGHLTDARHRKANGPKMLEIVVQPGSEIAIAAGSDRFRTSNYHHAAVNSEMKLKPEVSAQITAYDVRPDGTRGQVVKAIEFPDNAGFATQFHPEFEGSDAEKKIVEYVATGWQLRGRYAPAKIVECMEKRLMKLMPPPSAKTAPANYRAEK